MGLFEKSQSEHTEKALDWESDRIASLEKSEIRAWWIARGAIGGMFIAMVTLAMMLPFYKIIPVTFQVDKVTGEAMMVNTSPTSITPTEAISRHYAARYVQTRERYVWSLLQIDFDTVRSLSDDKVDKDYIALFQGENALDKKLGANTEMKINLISVTIPPNEPNKALVRFERTTKRNGVETETNAKYFATISFKYEPPRTFAREREVIDNPFGFKVDGYVVNSEGTSK